MAMRGGKPLPLTTGGTDTLQVAFLKGVAFARPKNYFEMAGMNERENAGPSSKSLISSRVIRSKSEFFFSMASRSLNIDVSKM